MRRNSFLLVLILAMSGTALAEGTFWTPSSDQIALFESKTKLPLPIDRYARYYVGIEYGNSRLGIRAQYVQLPPGEKTSINILKDRALPSLAGQGCVGGIVPIENLTRGLSVGVRCTAAGDWTPTDAQIAELEGTIKLPSGAYPVEDYARSYTGVMTNDRHIIRGEFTRGGAKPGFYVVSSVELPGITDGGCNYVDVNYDADSHQVISIRCHGLA